MKYIANNRVFKAVTAWLLVVSMLVAMASSTLITQAENTTNATDYNDKTIQQLLESDEQLTWVFAGDSITHNATFTAGMNGYAEWFEQYLNATGRDNDSVVISAWGGADVYDFQTKANTPSGSGTYDYPGMGIENMITKYNPDVVFIKLGMNDRYKTTKEYTKYYNQLLDSMISICSASYGKIPKIILLTPTPTAGESVYDDMKEESKVEANWDSTLRHCEAVQQIAKERNLICVNLREAFIDAQLQLGDDYFATFFRDPSDGGIHPNAAGQYMMFKKLAETLELDMNLPIFKYQYEDFLAGELFTDLTSNVIYENGYDEIEESSGADNAKLLASIDFTSENGAFKKFTKTELEAYKDEAKKDYIYNNATHIDLTDASKCDDPLTLEEAQSLTNEYSIVFRAKLDVGANDSMPILLISQTEADWKNALAVGVPGYKGTNKGRLYLGLRQNNESKLSESGPKVTADATMDGNWHDFAVVQEKDQLIYYMDGAVFATSTAYVKDGFSIGSLVSEGKFVAQIGSYTKTARSYNLAADMDFYQLYKGALSATQVKELADKSGTFAETATTVTTDTDEMNKSMPSALTTGTKTIASVDFDSTNGVFSNAISSGSYTNAKRWDLTDANKCSDALTLSEVQALTNEFSVVFRAKLANNKKDTQGLLFLSDDDDYWDNSLVLHAPGKKESVYYEIRGAGIQEMGKEPKEQTTSPNTFSVQKDGSLSTGSWHTIGIVQSKDTFTYYIDGEAVFTQAISMKNSDFTIGSLFANLTEETGFVAHIGGVCKTEQTTSNLNASMDWYQLYGTALTADEVAELNGRNQMDAVMPTLPLKTVTEYKSAYKWSDVAPEKGADVWLVSGDERLMGNDGTVVNRSLYRLIDNAIRRTPTHRGTRLVDVAFTNYDEVVSEYQPLAYMYLPDLGGVCEADYVHSDTAVATFKAQVQEWLNKNKEKNIKSILWTPLASGDATINGYISDYAEAIRDLLKDTNNKMMFFDANRFMNENMAENSALSRNWFVDGKQLTALGARDVAYAFCMLSNMNRIADSKKEDEIAQHDLRATSDSCLFKGEYTRDLIQSSTSVSGTSITVDVSAIKAVYPNMTDFSFKVLPFKYASSYNAELYDVQATGNGNSYTFEAPCSDPNIAVFGKMNGKTYRFADCKAIVTAEDIRGLTSNPTEVSLESLEVVGAPTLSFDKNTKTYDVTLYSYQQFVQICATAQSGLTIKVDNQEVTSGEHSGLIKVESEKTVEVVVSGNVSGQKVSTTYTVNLVRPSYPDIIITEVMTDAEYKTGNGGDDYEMVEIYNTTDHELNLKDYSLGHTKDYRYTKLQSLKDYPTFYFTGDNQVFGASAERSRSYTGINQITKYSTYWEGGETEPNYIAFPAHSTMVIWVKFLDKTMTYDTLIESLKTAGEKYTLHINGQPIVPDKEQLVVAEVPASLSSTISKNNAVSKHAAVNLPNSVYENFYLANWTGETEQTSNWYARGWLYILKAGAKRDDNGSITEAGNDIVSASKFIKLTATNKLSSIFSYNVERGMSLIEKQDKWDEATWDTSYTTGHTSATQGYSNKTSFGAIEYWQKPYDLADKTAPTVKNNTAGSLQMGKDAGIALELTDNKDVRYLELYVKKARETEWTAIKEDFVMQAGMKNKGVSADITNYLYTYDLGAISGDIQYYGFVEDGNQNQTKIGSKDTPCVISAFEGGTVKVDMSIKNLEDAAATETITSEVTIVLEKGTATTELENSYDIMSGTTKVGVVETKEGKLTGTITMKNGDSILVKDLPDGAKYTVTVKAPKGYKAVDEKDSYSGNVSVNQEKTVQFFMKEKAKESGSLNVQMSIADEKGNPTTAVTSQVTITVQKGSAEQDFATSYDVMSGTDKMGTLTLENEKLVGTFTMKNGDLLSILGLPKDAEYEVTMTVPDKYEAKDGTEKVNGTISSTTAASVVLLLKEIPKPVGSVNVMMSMKDLDGDAAEGVQSTVTITVEKNTAEADFNSSYDVMDGSQKVGELFLENGKLVGTVTMKNNDIFQIAGLPENSKYTVKVTVPDGYKLGMDVSGEYTGTIHSEEAGNVLFELCEKDPVLGALQIQVSIKDKNGLSAADTIKAQVSILIEKGSALSDITKAHEVYNGDKKVGILSLRDGKLRGTILAKNGDVLEIKEVPESAKYTVTLVVPEDYNLVDGSAPEKTGVITVETQTVNFAIQEATVSAGTDHTTEEPKNESSSDVNTSGGSAAGTNGANLSSASTATKTGDNNHIRTWFTLIIVSLGVFYVCKRTKKNDQEA